jgi:CIC family chloride channel protein
MVRSVSLAASRLRLLISRALQRVGFREDSFLLLVAGMVGVLTATAAVGFHELIVAIRNLLYTQFDPNFLYRTGVFMLVVWPALGGLVVGIISNYIVRDRSGRGVVDVLESVIRSSGFIAPAAAIEKIFTSAITIGSGGSGGAEGPILQIGAAIASGIGQVFRLARGQMPLIVGCGTAAGISAIFNAPMGGLLFTLEVILQDFSIRTVTPVVVASVIGNVTTQAIFRALHEQWPNTYESTLAIFQLPVLPEFTVTWPQLAFFAALGITCGLVAVLFTRVLHFTERRFAEMRLNPAMRPAVGGIALGILGVLYVIIFGWAAQGQNKPIDPLHYPMPAFFGDGYGFIQLLFSQGFYGQFTPKYLLSLLVFLIAVKVLGTALTIGSGGSGGIIAPCLFLGAVVGGLLGVLLRDVSADVRPQIYALVGMGAVLAAVVHAPLASVLILLELSADSRLALPAMLSAVVATGVARRILPESIYTLGLRERGIRGGGADHMLLRRMHVEQMTLDPATTLHPEDPLQRVIDLRMQTGTHNFAVVDKQGYYLGMLIEDDINIALMQREAVPLLLVGELLRSDVPLVRNTDDLAQVLTVFSRLDVDYLPVCLAQAPGKVIGLIGRGGLMRYYQTRLAG